MGTRDEILRTMAEAYKKQKGRMLDHVVEVAGYNRAYASYRLQLSCADFRRLGRCQAGLHGDGMVAHEGGNPSGEYALNLNLTDVSSRWTKTECGQEQGPEVGFRGTGADSKQIALPAARPGLGQ